MGFLYVSLGHMKNIVSEPFDKNLATTMPCTIHCWVKYICT